MCSLKLLLLQKKENRHFAINRIKSVRSWTRAWCILFFWHKKTASFLVLKIGCKPLFFSLKKRILKNFKQCDHILGGWTKPSKKSYLHFSWTKEYSNFYRDVLFQWGRSSFWFFSFLVQGRYQFADVRLVQVLVGSAGNPIQEPEIECTRDPAPPPPALRNYAQLA